MRMKSFTAETLPEAMAQVRARLGEDAVILSTEPALAGVRVTAAATSGGMMNDPEGERMALSLMQELTQVLDFHGVPRALGERLISLAGSLPDEQATVALAAALDAEFSFAPLPWAPTPKPLIFVGPAGAGKTATLAKMAAQARMKGAPVTLITLDLGKAGGLAQIAAFAQALGAALYEARDSERLARVIDLCADDNLILIDTIGGSPFDGDALSEVMDWTRSAGAEAVAVLSAGGDAMEAAEVAEAYAQVGAQRMIATKLDMTRRLGGLLSAAKGGNMAMMGLGVAATIGGGLKPVNPVTLARLLLPEDQAVKRGQAAVEAEDSFAEDAFLDGGFGEGGPRRRALP